MSDAIQQAIAAAQAAAAATAAVAQPAPSTAVATTTGTAMTAPVAPGKKLNMETVMTGQLNVDAWLKPKEFGLMIGDNANLFPNCIVSLDMTDGVGFVVKKGIKAGNPAQYFYTTDGVTCVSGGSWEAAVMKAKGIDSKAYEYRCVDLPFTLLEDVKDAKGGVIKEAGTKLGYTTSTTNWKAWEAFYQECLQKGLMNEPVKVKLGFERKTNKSNNAWGIVTFELVGSMADEMAGAE